MKVILYMAITINGFIAGKYDDTSWVSTEEWESFREIVHATKNMVVGRRTYELMRETGELINEILTVVVSSEYTNEEADDNLYLTNKSPKEIIEFLSEKEFDTVLIAGGSKLNTSFLKEKLINEMYIDVEPKILGEGIQLFQPDSYNTKLELIDTKMLSESTIQLHYKVL